MLFLLLANLYENKISVISILKDFKSKIYGYMCFHFFLFCFGVYLIYEVIFEMRKIYSISTGGLLADLNYFRMKMYVNL